MPDRDPTPPHVRVRAAVRRSLIDLAPVIRPRPDNPDGTSSEEATMEAFQRALAQLRDEIARGEYGEAARAASATAGHGARPGPTSRDHGTVPLVLIACSGGPDSMALAVAARAEHERVGAVIIDHRVRAGSAAEAERTAVWLREAGLDPVVVRPVVVDPAGSGLEAGARRARYAALDVAAWELDAVRVLLGHTLDDQAETVLLGLARGSGVRSLAGMPRSRGIYLRPFLDLPRAVVRAAVPDGAPVVDDPHNADDRYARARVRHRILPVLEAELGPGIAEALARTADLARADADQLDELADERAYELMRGDELEAEDVDDLGPALLSRIVRTWLVDQGVRAGSLTAEHTARVMSLVIEWRGQGAVALPGGVEVVRECGRLRVRPAPSSLES